MNIIADKTFDAERALYGKKDLWVKNCAFDGPADGESAFKECRNITADGCFFNLRYPFWHDNGVKIIASEMTAFAVRRCGIHGILIYAVQSCMESRRCGSAVM